jgi:hypothetical protein
VGVLTAVTAVAAAEPVERDNAQLIDMVQPNQINSENLDTNG